MPLTPQISSNDHAKGNLTANIVVVEYGDYQCPHCGRAYPIVQSIMRKFGNDLKFIFRNFPLSKVHPDATAAAVASEAAGLQDKFWEMHSLLFENQQRLNNNSILNYAMKINLDMEQFKKDIQEGDLQKKVQKDFMSGLRSGVNATPTFFINGERYTESWDEETMGEYLAVLISGNKK